MVHLFVVSSIRVRHGIYVADVYSKQSCLCRISLESSGKDLMSFLDANSSDSERIYIFSGTDKVHLLDNDRVAGESGSVAILKQACSLALVLT
jgi:hypothetical protein